MKWFSKILVMMSLLNVVMAPAFAGGLTSPEQDEIEQYKKTLEPMGYQVKVDPVARKAFVFDKNQNQVAMEIPFGEEETLRRFSPKSMNRMMLDEMVKVKSAGQAAFSHSLKSLPSESLIFFMAMGAVVAGQLITNYSQNPVAMKQHIDNQLSPVGAFGFFAFMASQGLTSNVLSLYFKNPKFHYMIPYLGMSVGAFVQSYLSQVVSDPNVIACGKQMIGQQVSKSDLESGVDADPCSKAYEYLVLKKKIWEFAPGMVSMLASSALAGMGQWAVTKTVVKLTGFDVALWLIPGGMQLKGLRLVLVKGLQIAAFVAIDAWLNQKVTFAWKNFFDGNDFNSVNDRLNSEVNSLKSSNWIGQNSQLKDEIKNFRNKMTDWRLMNLSPVYEAHQAWSQNLFQLTSMYNSSYSFYNTFINEVRNVRFNQQPLKPLLISYPLNGVIAKGLQEDRKDLYFQSPKMVENWQADTVYDVSGQLGKFMASGEYNDLLSNEKIQLKKIYNLLASEDRNKMGEGLQLINDSLKDTQEHLIYSRGYKNILATVKNHLGNPDPQFEPGRGFLATYELAPSTAETLKGTPFYRQVGNMQTPHITEHLLMQMICGPDVENGASAVKSSRGFPSVFLPPQIKNGSDEFGKICDTLGRAKYPARNIFNWQVQSQDHSNFKGFVNYLVGKARPSVVGSESDSSFPQWWERTTESQVKKAFEEFTKDYDVIVVKMVDLIYNQDRQHYSNSFSRIWGQFEGNTKKFLDNALWKEQFKNGQREDKTIFNRGPISNSAMTSAFQEERTYLWILNELLSPNKAFNISFERILKTDFKENQLIAVESQFKTLDNLIRKIKVIQVDGHEVIESSLENYELEEQLRNIQKSLNDLSESLGVGDQKATNISESRLNAGQKEVAVICLQNLQALASEIMMYGSMANAVNWQKIRNLKQVSMEQNKFNTEAQAKLAKLRSLMHQ